MAVTRLLVVDDDPTIAALVADVLAVDGYEVETASNGRIALEKLQQDPYDGIVSDLQMPELDGPGLYGAVAQHYPHLCPRILFITGYALSPKTEAFLQHTGAPVLQKPFTLAEIGRAVRQMLGRE